MNIFSRQISVYDGVTDNVGRVITLHDFLFSKEYANVIQMMRCIADKEERDKWKRRLPQAAISGVFAPTRAVGNIKQYSGLISIDVDSKKPRYNELGRTQNSVGCIASDCLLFAQC